MVKNYRINKGELIYIMDKKLKYSFMERMNLKLEKLQQNLIISLILIPIITSLVASGIGYALVWIFTVSKKIGQINEKYEGLEARIESIENNNISNNGNDNVNINGDNNDTITGGNNHINSGNTGTIINGDVYILDPDKVSELLKQKNGVQTGFYTFPSIKAQENQVIAINELTREEATVAELSNEKIFCTYEANNQEILFYGQFTEEGKWDGDCLINVYENDNLVNITESKYEKGVLLQYKQVVSFTNSRGNNVWSISDRTMVDDKVSSGESRTYYKIEDCSKKFNVAGTDDLIYVEDFEKMYCSAREGYYYGRTSNGFYNDTTGKSYNIKYFKNGKIRTLYVGDFVNGIYKDDSGEAWYITKEENTQYMHYIGKFDKNTAAEKATTENSENNLTRSRIDEILIDSGRSFKYLDWDFEE